MKDESPDAEATAMHSQGSNVITLILAQTHVGIVQVNTKSARKMSDCYFMICMYASSILTQITCT